MSATGAEDESGTVREEGTCGEDKVVKGKQLMEKSEFSVMSPGLPVSYVSAILESCAVVLLPFFILCP